jgi:hypothetical protein
MPGRQVKRASPAERVDQASYAGLAFVGAHGHSLSRFSGDGAGACSSAFKSMQFSAIIGSPEYHNNVVDRPTEASAGLARRGTSPLAMAAVRIESVEETRAARRQQKKAPRGRPKNNRHGVPVAEETSCARLEVVHQADRENARIRAGSNSSRRRRGVAVIGVIGDLVGTV